MKSNNVLFFLALVDVTKYSIASYICPSPVIDDIGVGYNSKERFDNVRNAVGNELRTRFVHHRRHHDGRISHDEFEYIFTFCGNEGDKAVTQIDKESTEHKIGLHDKASVLVGAENWLLLQYMHGEKYGHHCHGQAKQAWISIRCEDQGEKPQLKVIEEALFSSSNSSIHPDRICYFLFEFNHPAACSPKKKSLSGGAIFCIIVLVLFAAYFIFGFIYQRVMLRATGLDQIPHYNFWKKVGNTMADGCDFVCRTKDVSNSYKGITDDLDIESSDDDKDGLLPM